MLLALRCRLCLWQEKQCTLAGTEGKRIYSANTKFLRIFYLPRSLICKVCIAGPIVFVQNKGHKISLY